MSTVIKLKKSETAGGVPQAADLQVGEIAYNASDKIIYTKNAAGEIQPIANHTIADANLVYPTGDYGSLDLSSVDAFGVATERSFDARIAPAGVLTQVDLGAL